MKLKKSFLLLWIVFFAFSCTYRQNEQNDHQAVVATRPKAKPATRPKAKPATRPKAKPIPKTNAQEKLTYKPAIIIFTDRDAVASQEMEYFYSDIHKAISSHCKVYERAKVEKIIKDEFRELGDNPEELETFARFRFARWDAILYLSIKIEDEPDRLQSTWKKAVGKARLVKISDGREWVNIMERDNKGVVDWSGDAKKETIANVSAIIAKKLLEKLKTIPQPEHNIVRITARFSSRENRDIFYEEFQRLAKAGHYSLKGSPIMLSTAFGSDIKLGKHDIATLVNLFKDACKTRGLEVIVQTGGKEIVIAEDESVDY